MRSTPSTWMVISRLGELAQQRDFVDREADLLRPFHRLRPHLQRMQGHDLAARQPLRQPVGTVPVHQEADRAAIHPEDVDRTAHMPMQGLQHGASPPRTTRISAWTGSASP